MILITRIYHLLWNAIVLGSFFVVAAFINTTSRHPDKRRARQVANMHRHCKQFRKALRMTVHINGSQTLEGLRDSSYLLVANHVSYLDVIVFGPVERLVFITSVEMGQNSIMGPITRNGGCLFTNRRKFVSLPNEIERFSVCIASGFKLALFPEGTSTNGSTVNEFKGSLFQVAIGAKAPVLPVCVRYLSIDGVPVTSANRDQAFWYGDMTFFPHFWQLMGRKIEVEVNVLPLIDFDPYRTRAQLSQLTHATILNRYRSYPDIEVSQDNPIATSYKE
jgi:1-acyl-sn-glycerol-3-phosphate acyltransferase